MIKRGKGVDSTVVGFGHQLTLRVSALVGWLEQGTKGVRGVDICQFRSRLKMKIVKMI